MKRLRDDFEKLHKQLTGSDPINEIKLRTTATIMKDRIDLMEKLMEMELKMAVESKRELGWWILVGGIVLVSKPKSESCKVLSD